MEENIIKKWEYLNLILFTGKKFKNYRIINSGFFLCRDQGLLIRDNLDTNTVFNEFGKLGWKLFQIDKLDNYCYVGLTCIRIPPFIKFFKKTIYSFWFKRIFKDGVEAIPNEFMSLSDYCGWFPTLIETPIEIGSLDKINKDLKSRY